MKIYLIVSKHSFNSFCEIDNIQFNSSLISTFIYFFDTANKSKIDCIRKIIRFNFHTFPINSKPIHQNNQTNLNSNFQTWKKLENFTNNSNPYLITPKINQTNINHIFSNITLFADLNFFKHISHKTHTFKIQATQTPSITQSSPKEPFRTFPSLRARKALVLRICGGKLPFRFVFDRRRGCVFAKIVLAALKYRISLQKGAFVRRLFECLFCCVLRVRSRRFSLKRTENVG